METFSMFLAVRGIYQLMANVTKASDTELWSAPEQTVRQTIEALVIWDAIALIVTSL